MGNPSVGSEGDRMSNEKRYPAVSRRIMYLEQELYTYDKYLRDPKGTADMAAQAAMASNADQMQQELDELMTLKGLADKAQEPSQIRIWQAVMLGVFSFVSILIAGLSLYLSALH